MDDDGELQNTAHLDASMPRGALLQQCERAVKFLCEKSQQPGDDFDVMAMKLAAAADAAMPE